MRQYECFELTFTGPEPEGSWAQAELRAEFVCEGKARKVDGFYAGSGLYKVRFYPDRAGVYSWKVTGAVAAEGEEICQAAASGPEDASARGIVRAAGRHFKYDGGGWYRPFGTTVYAL